ncbi:family 1 glycosylhydrolase [Chengkuizengella sediminis]|uniref:family 1 glycosylhydrolase n=1 Tax=Chengkuizengella sediminis TaxID=1885917 RepID=UPI00138A4479|nr:family 1 glycosylhydrolase [Chengkuizengella sediminis]NDI36772.1 family 1 glycosylhydrolase [Chengkuizengella sediminis]
MNSGENKLDSKGWGIDVSNGLHVLLMRLDRDYGKISLWVTENGVEFPDINSKIKK